ncbi:MAG: FAD-dependent oxidoreductase [Candidatus Solibacter usitatus]|nr:FAD-dependent oxidoreductase [Candidatus Solibacter usitatus]
MPTRREFGATALAGLTAKADRKLEGAFVFEAPGQGVEAGHRLRDHARFAAPARRVRIPAVIVGGGVAGLSAAWHFDRRGFRDFVLLELEQQAGGNARSGENAVSAYPWAAHYLPVPDKRQPLVHELCRELGLLHDDGTWDERWLCHSPQERLFIHGRWQEGIEPLVGLTKADAAQYAHFEERIAGFRLSGAFRIPMEAGLAQNTAAHRALDGVTMGEWMRREGLYSPYLKWFIDYSTRDDYGTRAADISAWAGLHYFAARAPEEKGPLTWPEGNGWIVKRLLAKLGRYVRTGAMVHRIQRQRRGWLVFTGDTVYEADFVVYAAPTHFASWLIDPPPPRWPIDSAPWLTANLTLDRWPANHGVEFCWDNVIYNSPSLGYVIATHQNLNTRQDKTVWTYYWALADGRAADQRRILLGGDWNWWKEKILTDLERAHPDIRRCVSRLDIFRIGHAMPRPVPGAIFHPERIARARHQGSLVYANCDLSALSLFEEAQYRGVSAADYVLRNASSTATR